MRASEGVQGRFERFADLPTELRLKIWDYHFNNPDQRHVHAIHSRTASTGEVPEPPHYVLFSTAGNRTDVVVSSVERVQATMINHEAYNVFLESCTTANLLACGPRRLPKYFRSKLAPFAEGAPDSANGVSRFLVNTTTDLVYIIDRQNGRLFSRLCGALWMARVPRIALAVSDGQPGPQRRNLPYNTDSKTIMRDMMLEQDRSTAQSISRRFMSDAGGAGAARFSEFVLVALPRAGYMSVSGVFHDEILPTSVCGALGTVERRAGDEFGFSAFKHPWCLGVLERWECEQAWQAMKRMTMQIELAFPRTLHDYRVRYAVDVNMTAPIAVCQRERKPRQELLTSKHVHQKSKVVPEMLLLATLRSDLQLATP